MQDTFFKMGVIIKLMKTQFLEKHLSGKITTILSNNKSIMKTNHVRYTLGDF